VAFRFASHAGKTVEAFMSSNPKRKPMAKPTATDTPARIADLVIERMRNRQGIPLSLQSDQQPLWLCRIRYQQADELAGQEALASLQAYAAKLGLHFDTAKRLGAN